MNEFDSRLLEQRAKFLAYIRRKVPDPDLAEDVLQDSLLRALQAAPALRDEERLIPWFYRILDNAIMDVYRRRQVESKYRAQYSEQREPYVPPEDVAALCACIWDVIPTLKPEYAELIVELELWDGDPARLAAQVGITRNNLKVRRHRARQALRQRLEEICRSCAVHGYPDCPCQHGKGADATTGQESSK
jgi:RNA polymerase sigma-70 factor (ECF subfamily)